MYQISCDGYILHDSRLDKTYRVINPVLQQSLNTAGTLTFQISPTHPYYAMIKKLSSVITVTQDGVWLFSGRVLNDEKKFNRIKSITVEGELSYLNDSIQRKASYHNVSVSDYFTSIITNHNSAVETAKQFLIGDVTVTDPNDSIERAANYETTQKTISDKLIGLLGGYIRTRHTADGTYIDYITDYNSVSTQTINFGKNLVDLTDKIKGEKIATALIPLGAKLPDSEERITISEVNDNCDYVYDADAAYGYIFDTVTFDDVTIPANLKTKAEALLTSRKLFDQTISLTAVDLHILRTDVERIKLGDSVRVVSAPHGIDKYMIVSSITTDLEKPGNSKLTLGVELQTLTGVTKNDGLPKKVETIINDLKINDDITSVRDQINEVASSVTQSAEDILLTVYSNCSTKDELTSATQLLQSNLEILNNLIEFKFTSASSREDSIDDTIASNQALLEQYIRFQGALIQLGKTDSDFTAELSNEKLAFLEKGNEIAYVSNNKLYITDAEISKLTIGTSERGYYDWIVRENGHLTLKWRAS